MRVLRFRFANVYRWVYTVIVVLVFIGVRGYQFNDGDQAELLPPVYQRLDPTLYPGDFYLTALPKTPFTVREAYFTFVYGLSYFLGVESTCFLLTFLSLCLSVDGLIRLAEGMGLHPRAAWLVPPVVLLILANVVIGENRLQESVLTPSTIGMGLALQGWAAFVHGKRWLALIWLAAASWFHVLIGLHLTILLTLAGNCKTWKFILVYGFLVFPLVWPILYGYFNTTTNANSGAFANIFFKRSVHYLPSIFSLKSYLQFAGLCLITALVWRRSSINNKPFWGAFLSWAVLGLVVYTVLIELFGVLAIGAIQWFKVTMYMNIVMGVTLMGTIQTWLLRLKLPTPKLWMLVGVILIGFGMLFFSRYLPHSKLRQRYQVGFYEKRPLTQLNEWVKNNTPKSAMFLVPPDINSFGCEAQRPMICNYKAVVQASDAYAKAWYRCSRRYYGFCVDTLNQRSAYQLATESFYRKVAEFFSYPEVDYVLLDTTRVLRFTRLPKPLHCEGCYCVYRVAGH